MTKKHIYIYKNKKTQEVFADLFAKDLLEGVTTFPQIDNAQSYSFLELSCLYLKRILEMKEIARHKKSSRSSVLTML